MTGPVRFRPECVAKGWGLRAGPRLTRFRRVCAKRSRTSASDRERLQRVRGVFAWAWLVGGAIQRVSGVSPRACSWAFDVAGVGNRGACAVLIKRAADVRFVWQAWGSGRMSALGKALGRIRVAGAGNRAS